MPGTIYSEKGELAKRRRKAAEGMVRAAGERSAGSNPANTFLSLLPMFGKLAGVAMGASPAAGEAVGEGIQQLVTGGSSDANKKAVKEKEEQLDALTQPLGMISIG
jgi:hypothetical protein